MSVDTGSSSGSGRRASGLRNAVWRVLQAFFKQPDNASVPISADVKPNETTTTGRADVESQLLSAFIAGVSSERSEVYDEVEEIESFVVEVAIGLNILADNATITKRGDGEIFRIEWAEDPGDGPKDIVNETIRRCQLHTKMRDILRTDLLFGDGFHQPVLNKDLIVSRLMYMPPKSMVRNEYSDGLLMEGATQGEWAFEQYEVGTTNLIDGFYPWQIIHNRFNKLSHQKYGRSLLYPVRGDFKKMHAMEEAMVMNWVTKAFDCLVYYIDVSGKSDAEADRAIKDFKRRISTLNVDSGARATERLSVVKDLFIGVNNTDYGGGNVRPSLTKVDVLNMSSSGFTNLDPIEYFRNKVIMATHVPKAYYGIEEDINAKATLQREDLRFAQTLRHVQNAGTFIIKAVLELSLIMQGINPYELSYTVKWENPAAQDPIEEAHAYEQRARGDRTYLEMGVIDPWYVQEKSLGLSTAEIEVLMSRIQSTSGEMQTPRGESAGESGSRSTTVPKAAEGDEEE